MHQWYFLYAIGPKQPSIQLYVAHSEDGDVTRGTWSINCRKNGVRKIGHNNEATTVALFAPEYYGLLVIG